MKRFLLATDLSENAERAFARAVCLARQHRAEMRVLHVVDDPHLPTRLAEAQRAAAEEILKERLQALAGDAGISASVSTVVGKPFAAILREATSWPADVIVIGTHRADLLQDMFRGTTAERVIRLGHIPVLVVKEGAPENYRRAVVGFDFSLHALRATQCGFGLAPQVEFHLIHAFLAPLPVFLHDSNTQPQALEAHLQAVRRTIDEEMTAFLARFGDQVPSLQRAAIEGPPQGVLLREVDRLRPDLLVVGTHGRTGIAHAFLGSVAEDLLHQAPCDVLVAKAW